tara:strand:+ start:1589 stop:1795 length:207 start_codon:yes stop_codon:yes gene_type:complete
MTRARETAKAGNYTEKAFPTGSNLLFRLNDQNLSSSVTIPADKNAMVAGPVSIDSGETLTLQGNLSIV